MAFEALEVSAFGGVPVALYEFARGPAVWRYCTADRNIIHGGNTYAAVAISDSGIPQSGDPSADDLTIEMPAAEAVPALFRGTPPTDAITVTIRRMHYGDTDSRVFWVGFIAAVGRGTDDLASKIVCKNIGATFDTDGVSLSWARNCPYVLYDPATCKTDKTEFRVSASPTGASGQILTVPAAETYAAETFSGGFIEWTTTDGAVDRRGISAHVGARLTLYGLTDGVPIGSAIFLYFGCGRTTSQCLNKFNNLPNFGGIPALPGVSPFAGRQNY